MYTPDKFGNLGDILLGFHTDDEYLEAEEKYHGAVVGRYCGRIPYGKVYGFDNILQLPLNDSGKHHLHGGSTGFHLKEWEVNLDHSLKNKVSFHLLSKDGEEGYPGELKIQVTYTLTDDNKLIFSAKATTSKKTIINLTNHAFFNLSCKPIDLENHCLTIRGDELVLDDEFLLTGKVIRFQNLITVVLKGEVGSAFLLKHKDDFPDVVLHDPDSGRSLKIYTNQSAVQLYNGFFMTGIDIGKNGKSYTSNTGLAIEPQFLIPGELNILQPEETYNHTSIYEFG